MKRKGRIRSGALLQIGAPKDTVATLEALESALQYALFFGREVAAVEIAKQIGELGGVKNVTITNSTFMGR